MPAGAAFRKECVMVSEDNKAIVLLALRHWNDKNLPAWFDLIHDEATYLLPYLPERFQYGGPYNKADTVAARCGSALRGAGPHARRRGINRPWPSLASLPVGS